MWSAVLNAQSTSYRIERSLPVHFYVTRFWQRNMYAERVSSQKVQADSYITCVRGTSNPKLLSSQEQGSRSVVNEWATWF